MLSASCAICTVDHLRRLPPECTVGACQNVRYEEGQTATAFVLCCWITMRPYVPTVPHDALLPVAQQRNTQPPGTAPRPDCRQPAGSALPASLPDGRWPSGPAPSARPIVLSGLVGGRRGGAAAALAAGPAARGAAARDLPARRPAPGAQARRPPASVRVIPIASSGRPPPRARPVAPAGALQACPAVPAVSAVSADSRACSRGRGRVRARQRASARTAACMDAAFGLPAVSAVAAANASVSRNEHPLVPAPDMPAGKRGRCAARG